MIMRLRTAAVVAAGLLAAACSSEGGAPTGPTRSSGTGFEAVGGPVARFNTDGDACWVSPAALEQLFRAQLFGGTAPPPEDTLSVAQAASVRLGNALRQLPSNEFVGLTMARTLKSFLAERLAAGQFKVLLDGDPANDALAATWLEAMQRAIDYLVFPAGQQPPCPTDLGDAGIVGAGGGTVVADNAYAATTLPAGAVDQPVLVRITETGDLLPTDLTQYPLFFSFQALRLSDGEPVGPFLAPVDVAICLQGNPDLSPALDLRVARGTGSTVGSIEILPLLQTSPALDALNCAEFQNTVLAPRYLAHPELALDGDRWSSALRDLAARVGPRLADLLLPARLDAAVLLRTCCTLGGQTGSFSPFGAVDINSAAIQPAGPTTFEAPAGTSVTPSVRLYNTGSNAGLRGETVRFTASGGGSVTPATAITGQAGTGLASATWTIADAPDNVLTATGLLGRERAGPPLAIPLVPVPAANGNPVMFAATVTVPVSGGAWNFGVYRNESSAVTALFGTAALPSTATTFAKYPNCSLRTDNFFTALRRSFSVPSNWKGVRVTVVSDAPVRVWVDGFEATGGSYAPNVNCPRYTTSVFTIENNNTNRGRGLLNGTAHTVRVLGKDKANSLYFSATVESFR